MTAELPAYVQALLKPETYPERPARIELVQTQMSFVFLTGEFTYKTKKAVNLGYLDYTTLEKRQYFCRQELELNRRLCPAAYLDVLPIVESGGKFKFGGSGTIVEYAVKMKQLPHDRMMDVLLPKDQVTPAMLEKVAARMAAFHAGAAASEQINSFGSLEAIRVNTDENFSQTEKYLDKIIPERSYRLIMDFTNTFMTENAGLFKQRTETGKIRDCHGDLHAAHVCFADDICIFDCIEFNDRFRYCDVASEIAFLAMDIDRYARADLSNAFVQSYIKASGDGSLSRLLDFYKCYRAYVRGKVACFKYDDPYLADKDSILREARLYFNLAHKYADKKPVVIIVTGLIGTGKTTVANLAGRCLGYDVLSSDIIRKQLEKMPLTERHHDTFDSGLYSPESKRRAYSELFSRAQDAIKAGRSVILDASFMKRADRISAFNLAREGGASFLAVECTADEMTIKQRLEERVRESSVSDGRWEIFADIKKGFDPIDELPAENHLVLDTVRLSGNTISSVLLERVTRL